MYAGLSILFFFLTIFLQQIGGYTPLAGRPCDAPGHRRDVHVLQALRRVGGPLWPASVHGGRDRWSRRVGCCCSSESAYTSTTYDVLPGILVFSLGLSMTVAPLTAAVLAGVETAQAESPRR